MKRLVQVPLQVGEPGTLTLTPRPWSFCPTPAAFLAVFQCMPPKLAGMLRSAPGRGPPIRACGQGQRLAQRHWPWSTFSHPLPGLGGPLQSLDAMLFLPELPAALMAGLRGSCQGALGFLT